MMRVEGHNDLAKTQNGAIIVTDPKIYQRAKQRKKERQRIDEIEKRMERIENLLIQLVSEK